MKDNKNNKFSARIIETIKKEKIKPIPKIYFFFSYLMAYLMIFFFVMLASFFFSITYSYYFFLFEPELLLVEGFSLLLFFTLPIISILLCFIFTYAIYYLLSKKVERGYKFTFKEILISSCIIIFSIGNIMYFFGLTIKAEKIFFNNIGFSEVIIKREQKQLVEELWSNPEKGLLIGNVKDIIPENHKITITDKDLNVWHIYYIEDTIIKNANIIEKGTTIKIKGKLEGGKIFTAKEIFPIGIEL